MPRQRLICFILSALVTLLAYLPVAKHGFLVYDDPDYVTENHVVQAGLTPATIAWAFTTFHASNWHPLTWLSLELDLRVVRPGPSCAPRHQRVVPCGQCGVAAFSCWCG